MKHNLSGLTPEQMAAVLALGDEQQTAAEPEVSPLLKVLRDIAASRARSIHWFNALAPAAESAVPARHAIALSNSSRHVHDRPAAARTKPTAAVIGRAVAPMR